MLELEEISYILILLLILTYAERQS